MGKVCPCLYAHAYIEYIYRYSLIYALLTPDTNEKARA